MEAVTKEKAEQLTVELSEQRGIKMSAEDLIKSAQTELIEIMEGEKVDQVKAQTSTDNLTATLVAGEAIVIDEVKLKKKLGAKVWKQIAPPTLDRKLLDNLLESGQVNVADVAACSVTVPRTKYIKVTSRKRPTKRAAKKTSA